VRVVSLATLVKLKFISFSLSFNLDESDVARVDFK